MTIYEIRDRSAKDAPYFFSKDTLKFFGQTMSKFKIKLQPSGNYRITQPIRDRSGVNRGQTVRYFNPTTNKLQFSDDETAAV